MVKVKLLRDIGETKAGIIEVTPERAKYWKQLGVAEDVKEEKKAPPKKKG